MFSTVDPINTTKIVLGQSEIDILFRQHPSTKSAGGFQNFLISLQNRTNRNTGQILLALQDIVRIQKYAFDYGQGGWEWRLKAIFGRSLGPNLDGSMAFQIPFDVMAA